MRASKTCAARTATLSAKDGEAGVTATNANRLIERVLHRWVGFVQTHARAVLCLAIAGALASIAYTACFLGFKTSRSDLIDPRDPTYQNWVRFTKDFGDDADIIVAVQGVDRARIISAIETVARDLVAQPQHFEKTCHRINVDRLKAKGLYQLPLESVRKVAAKVDQMTPLLLGGWQLLSVENMLSAARLKLATLPAEKPVDASAVELLTTAAALLDSLATSLENPNIYRSPWRAAFNDLAPQQAQEIPDYFFSRDGRLGFLRTIPVKNAASFTGFCEPVRIARKIVDRVSQAYPDMQFGLTGLPVLEDDEMQAAQQASGWSTGLSIVGVALLFFTGFRAIRHPLLGIGSLAICGCWTLGWVTLTVGHLNILSVAFIVTLIGMGIDYGIVWLSRYESQRARGSDNFESNLTSATTVAPGIFTSAVTTAVAFLTTMTTGFLGLQEMGWIAGSGILICMVGTFTVLPALLTLVGRRDMNIKDRFASERPFWPWIDRRPTWALVALAASAGFLAIGIPKVRMDYNLLNMQAQGLPSVKLEHELIDRTGSSGFYALSVADTAEEAIALKNKFEKLPTVGRVVELASLMPADMETKTPILASIQNALSWLPPPNKLPQTGQSNLPGIASQLTSIAQVKLPTVEPQASLVRSIQQSAVRLQAVVSHTSESESERRLSKYERRWSVDLIDQLRELNSVSKPEPVRFEDLPVVLKERYRSATGKWLVQVFPKDCIWDMEPLQAFVGDLEKVDPLVTGHPVTAMNSLLQMTRGYEKSACLSLLVIFVSVLLDFRSLRTALLAMTPLALGCISMLGVMGWTGLAFNPANTIALPLILGVGVNYGVYMMHDYRQSTERRYFLCRRLARAIGLSALTTIVGFASLLCAKHWGMISIGLVLSIGVSACLVNVLFLLPPLLNLLSGANKETESESESPDILPFPSVKSNRQAA